MSCASPMTGCAQSAAPSSEEPRSRRSLPETGLISTGLVDAHQHVWDLAAHDQPWLAMPGLEPIRRNFTAADLRPLALAAGVSATVVVQTVTELTETTELVELAAGSDLVAAVVGWAQLRDAD